MIDLRALFVLVFYLVTGTDGFRMYPLHARWHVQTQQDFHPCDNQPASIASNTKTAYCGCMTTIRMSLARISIATDEAFDFNELEECDDDADMVEVSEEQLLEHWLLAGGEETTFDTKTALNSYIQSQKSFMDDGDESDSDPVKAPVSDGGKKEMETKSVNSVSEDTLRKMLESTRTEPTVDISNQHSVGIDLGTSNSAVSRIVNGEAQIVMVGGSRTVPSAVSYLPNSTVLVGKPALQRRLIDPFNTFLSIKRIIGKKQKTLPKELPFDIHVNDTDQMGWRIFVPTIKRKLSAEDISAEVLKYLLREVSKSLNVSQSSITRAVITVPAYFTVEQCSATERAGILAGLEKVKLLREPEAAAFAYGLTQRERQIVLVFDLGGGTFDVSVLDVGDGFAEVIATSGDSQLGGDDFDAAIVAWMIEQFIKKYPDTKHNRLRKNADTMSRLYETAERIKVSLTKEKVCSILVPSIYEGKDLSCELSREKFETLTSKLLSRLLIPMREVALMSGINLAGESLNTDEEITELEDAVNSQGATTPSLSDAEDISISKLKKIQQTGRRNAKIQKKMKSDFTKEMSRLRSETGNNNLAAFPGGYSLNDVILVGGATRMPSVQRMIQGLTGIKPRLTVNPDEAVSLGAAVFAGTLDGTLHKMQVMSSWQAALYRAFYENYNKEHLNRSQKKQDEEDNKLDSRENTVHSGQKDESGTKIVAKPNHRMDKEASILPTDEKVIKGKMKSRNGLIRRIKENKAARNREG